MTGSEQPFSFGNKQKERHAGDLPVEQGGERPIEGAPRISADLQIPDRVTGFTEEEIEEALQARHTRSRKEEDRPGFWTRGKIVAAGSVAAVATGIVGVALFGGASDKDQTRPSESISASDTPNPEATPSLTEAQQERAALQLQVPNEAMLLPEYFEPGGDAVANIERTFLYNNLQKALDNITYMRETGDFSIMSRTFLMDSDGNFPGAELDVEGIKNQYEINKGQQEMNPNQPVSSLLLANVEDIETAGFGTFEVTAVVNETTYANPSEDTIGSETDTLIRKRFTIQMVEEKVLNPATGEETDGTEKIFVILSQESLGLA